MLEGVEIEHRSVGEPVPPGRRPSYGGDWVATPEKQGLSVTYPGGNVWVVAGPGDARVSYNENSVTIGDNDGPCEVAAVSIKGNLPVEIWATVRLLECAPPRTVRMPYRKCRFVIPQPLTGSSAPPSWRSCVADCFRGDCHDASRRGKSSAHSPGANSKEALWSGSISPRCVRSPWDRSAIFQCAHLMSRASTATWHGGTR